MKFYIIQQAPIIGKPGLYGAVIGTARYYQSFSTCKLHVHYKFSCSIVIHLSYTNLGTYKYTNTYMFNYNNIINTCMGVWYIIIHDMYILKYIHYFMTLHKQKNYHTNFN